MGLLFKKVVQKSAVTTLDRYTYKEFLKIPFWNGTSSKIFFKDFDHNYYNNYLKYAAKRTLFPVTPVTVSTKSEVYLKAFLVNSRISASNNWCIHIPRINS